MKQIRKRLTYANVMSSLAVFLVLGGGAAIAAKKLGKGSVGTRQLKSRAVSAAKIKRNAVSANKIRRGAVRTNKVRNGAITGAKVNESTLGAVPFANGASTASRASVAESLTTMSALKTVKTTSSATGPDFNTAATSATAVPLYDDGHFRLYGKCFNDESEERLYGIIYIGTRQAGAIFDGPNDELSGEAPEGYLDPTTVESDREVDGEYSEPNEAWIAGSDDFGATAADGYTLFGVYQIAVKSETLGTGNGPYGAGEVCMFSGYTLHS